MRRLRVVVVLAVSACGLFPDLEGLSGNDAASEASGDAIADAGAVDGDVADTATYADVRLNCEQRPCVVQQGETCCWFNGSQDTCVSTVDACAGFGDLACYGSIECLAVGKTTCCATASKSICTDLATCQQMSGTVLCDRNVDASDFGDPTNNGCPGTLACTGSTSFLGYPWRKCQ